MHRITRIAALLVAVPWMVVLPYGSAAAQPGEATSADGVAGEYDCDIGDAAFFL